MVDIADRKRVTHGLKSWLDDVATYDRAYQKWESRVDKILRRYRDEFRSGTEGNGYQVCKFNVLWSNVQTLTAATFARLPKPDVSRRFRDNDPVGRVASLILERALEYEIGHYADYRATLKSTIMDRFLGGRGTAWARYEPHFRAAELGLPVDGEQVTEDVDEPGEELDYECAPTDYVHWKEFGHSVARTWEEVGRVWRKVYMTEEALVARFGEKTAKLIPMDAMPNKNVAGNEEMKPTDAVKRACIYEGWDKNTKEAVWFSKAVKDFIDVRPDPLGLEEFFPCPKPLYATLTNDTLIPVPDFTLYQDQANDLDVLADRIDGLIKALRVRGVYDASEPALGRLFTEGDNNTLIPVKNWQAFVEKSGLKGSIDIVDLTHIAGALREAYGAMAQVKMQVDELTGISDIVRGETNANETATAQRIKSQYASLRLKTYQEQVALFATELLQQKAQIMCNKFSPDTLAKISAVEQLSPQDQQLIPQAMELLLGERIVDPESQAANPLRSFRIEVAADSLVLLDEQAEKESRMEFLNATGQFVERAGMILMNTPPEAKGPVAGMLMEMLKFGATGFKIGKNIEGVIDETAEKLKQLANQPPPPPQPDPRMEVEKMKGEIAMQVEPMKAQAEMAKAEASVLVSQNAMQESAFRAANPIQ